VADRLVKADPLPDDRSYGASFLPCSDESAGLIDPKNGGVQASKSIEERLHAVEGNSTAGVETRPGLNSPQAQGFGVANCIPVEHFPETADAGQNQAAKPLPKEAPLGPKIPGPERKMPSTDQTGVVEPEQPRQNRRTQKKRCDKFSRSGALCVNIR